MAAIDRISSFDFPAGSGGITDNGINTTTEYAMTMTMTDQAAARSTRSAEARWFLGTAIKILVSASDGNDDLCVVEHRMPRGESPPLHVHRNEDEVFVLLEGRMRLQLDGCTVQLEKGQATLAPKGLPHSFVVESDEARVLTITKGHDFETMLREMSRPAAGAGLPPRKAPTPEMVAALTDTCRRHNIDMIGPPLA
jgi:quercetin dioxygenase-like cupin family protein